MAKCLCRQFVCDAEREDKVVVGQWEFYSRELKVLVKMRSMEGPLESSELWKGKRLAIVGFALLILALF